MHEAYMRQALRLAEEAARAIFYLASDQSAFVTGQVLPVDGGMVI